MVFSYYLKYPIYNILWHIVKYFRWKKNKNILYCEDAFDAFLFQNVGIYLQKIEIVAKNRKVKRDLINKGYTNIKLMPSFPDSVIMFRNMAWKFPCKNIIKIGFTHGAFNFKKHSKPNYYNMFDLFFLTSTTELDRVRKLGVTTKLAVAYPKIDSINKTLSSILPQNYNKDKKTILFSATWDKSGMSAIHKWYSKISLLANRFNIFVTVHDWTSKKYVTELKNNPNVFFIEEFDRLKYIQIADICVNDTSSLIAECCLLNKPLITFRINNTERTLNDVIMMIEKISIRIDEFEEIEAAIDLLLANKDMFDKERKEISEIFFDKPDFLSGKRAAELIKSIISS